MNGIDRSRIYLCSGLRIRSPVPLAGPVVAGDAYNLEVFVGERCRSRGSGLRLTSLPNSLLMATRGTRFAESARISSVDSAGARTLLSPPTCAGWCATLPDAGVDLLPIFVVGTVAALVLSEPGLCVLHASAVEVEGDLVSGNSE